MVRPSRSTKPLALGFYTLGCSIPSRCRKSSEGCRPGRRRIRGRCRRGRPGRTRLASRGWQDLVVEQLHGRKRQPVGGGAEPRRSGCCSGRLHVDPFPHPFERAYVKGVHAGPAPRWRGVSMWRSRNSGLKRFRAGSAFSVSWTLRFRVCCSKHSRRSCLDGGLCRPQTPRTRRR